ncbi:MAG: hypothetical protein K1V71_07320, partial [Paramuribaculum sp.]
MKISFNVDYHTVWGESLALCLSRPLDGPDSVHPLPMAMLPGTSIWHIELACADLRSVEQMEYTYIVVGHDGSQLRKEWKGHFVPAVDAATASLELYDAWRDRPSDAPYLSTLFTDCVCRRPDYSRGEPIIAEPGTIVIEASAPVVPSDCVLAIAGSIPALGSWNPEEALECSDASYPLWRASFTIDE